jgi:protein-serine/threonine kinase
MMGYSAFRPLPQPPLGSKGYFNLDSTRSPGEMAYPYPYGQYPASSRSPDPLYDQRQSTLPGGTLLHMGFYDLLSMIPTPNPSRLLSAYFGAQRQNEPLQAGPRYEEIATPQAGWSPGRSPPTPYPLKVPSPPYPSGPPQAAVSPRKGRRISKDMVSKPTGFVCVHVHSVHDQHITHGNFQPPCACLRCRSA